ncbi:MAG: response regulator with CheY-like receiver, AAA-type ATPase, and DNA-binding domain [Bacteroidetes bacterium]|nr:response regulator with CheY-like receiver, AAA-type ATPase, and DNA-binding domain [Bacteroidota bacterium]
MANITLNIRYPEMKISNRILKLFKMVKGHDEIIEQRIKERTVELRDANNILYQKNKDIYDSMKYAKRLLDAILPPIDVVSTILPEHFILNKPKDIISGDFYWVSKHDNKIIVGVMDCTGHGVPGALLSVVGHNAINKTINELGITQPSRVLDSVNTIIKNTLRQDKESDIKDGMDMALCTFDTITGVMEYSGANNNLYIVSEQKLKIVKACRLTIGSVQEDVPGPPLNHSVQLKQGDCLYLFSDGYAHQFGRENNKKFNTNRFQKLLLSIHKESMEKQKNIILSTFNTWKGNYEQVDDVLIIGIRF